MTKKDRKYKIKLQKLKKEEIENENGRKPWGCAYIYIYSVRFNKTNLCKHRDKAMLFRRI